MTQSDSTFSPARRRTLKLAAGAALAGPFLHLTARASEPLLVNTWGGSWETAAAEHLFKPYTDATGVPVRTVSPVSFAKLAAQARTGVYEFDVTTLGGADLVRANEAGLIEPIDTRIVDVSTLAPAQALYNGVGSHAFATVLAYRKDRYENGGPRDWRQFFDVQQFAGPRTLQRHAPRVLPLGLVADGVAVDKLYPLDLDRAMGAMDRVKPAVRVWWTQGQQSLQLLRDGEVSAAAIWHGRVVELLRAKAPVELVWNQAQIDRAYWVVSKGSPRAEAAWKFIASAVAPERLAGFCRAADYGPLDPRAFEHIPSADAAMMPTFPDNYRHAFEQDVAALAPQLNEIARRFDRWVVR
ncbi:ABC transporter substrate-binding protein [Bordetella genomosp. 13]|uniref:ABC transporter substrate-binding protein n=1 Tax=Bordetella genomosp. 13 TaxID=463040 RepID=A0A1W6Z9Y2_9BORD|nr:ABC transporter substrate-binding protein [Bordetella genomosp. 13]ARP94127.1 ABC transporter substrate-binding protein [Bordetella genomosp. 13]